MDRSMNPQLISFDWELKPKAAQCGLFYILYIIWSITELCITSCVVQCVSVMDCNS